MIEFETLLDMLGEDATLKLVEQHGGTRVNIPLNNERQHHLRELLGAATFKKLHKLYGGHEIRVPIARQWRFEIYKNMKLKRKEIARRLGCDESTVYKYLRGGNKRPPGQLTMKFD